MTTTVKELTDLVNDYRSIAGDPPLKVGSYSKAKLEAMLKEFGHYEDEEPAAPVKETSRPTEEGTFSLAQLARELGISPKIARSRYRAYENDGIRTQYIFEDTKEERVRVTEVISPKKATK